jgi:hypothetical protein
MAVVVGFVGGSVEIVDVGSWLAKERLLMFVL